MPDSPDLSLPKEIADFLDALGVCSAAADRAEVVIDKCRIYSGEVWRAALLEQQAANKELDESFPPWDELVDLQRKYDKGLDRLSGAIAALATVPAHVTRAILGHQLSRLKLNRSIRATMDLWTVCQGFELQIGLLKALQDASGVDADEYARRVAQASSVGLERRLRQERGPNAGVAADAQHHIRMGLDRLKQGGLDVDVPPMAGKPRFYLKTAVEKNALHDALEVIFADRGRLAMTAKGKERRARVSLEALSDGVAEQQMAPEVDLPGAPSAIEALVDAERLAEQEAVIARFREGLPADQAALLDRWKADTSLTEARRELNLPESCEISLRRRIARLRRKLTGS